MRTSRASVLLGLLLGLSLTLKSLGGFALDEIAGPAEVPAFLHSIGFSASGATTEAWTEAHSGACTIEVMQVSHQGWERSAVDAYAGARKLAYIYGSVLYSHHPAIKATWDLYLSRLQAYLHLPFSASRYGR